jgi:hypothetical protein
MKRIISFIVCLLLLLNVSCTVFANETEKNIGETTERIFVSNLNLTSKESKENIQILGDDLEQIVLCAKKGNEVWSIGVLKCKNLDFDYDYICEVLNQEIKNIDTDLEYSANDFDINYYVVDKTYANNTSIQVNNIDMDRIFSTKKSDLKNTLNNQIFTLASGNRYPIDGSHYGYQIQAHRHYWYNQLTDTTYGILPTPVSPYQGDGNNRLDSGYRWFPGKVTAEFIRGTLQGTVSSVGLFFTFSESELENLNYDNNEALEMAVDFYNFSSENTPYQERGYSFLPVDRNPSRYTNGNDYKTPRSWSANYENAYLDTPFCDKDTIINISVGIADTHELVPDKKNVWYITYYGQAIPQGYPNDGRFRVTAQRSYMSNNGLPTAYRVFSEEMENIVKLGFNSNQNWVSADKNAFKLTESSPLIGHWTFDYFRGDPYNNVNSD